MKVFSKSLFFIALAGLIALSSASVNAQVVVTIHQPPPGQLNVDDLWSIDLTNNTQETFTVYLCGTATEESDGLIFEGSSNTFSLTTGFIHVNLTDLTIDIEYSNKEYEDIILRTGSVPEGEYTVCIRVINAENDEELGSGCIQQQVAHPSPPQLISPNNEITVEDHLPVFTWMPPMPLPPGQEISYDLKIVEILTGQSPIDAMLSNPAWFEQDGITTTSFRYSVGARGFESGKNYSWQVQALDSDGYPIGENEGKSEVWSFQFGEAVVIHEEPATLQLISPEDGEEIDTPKPRFEWKPIDTSTLITLTVTPEVSYNLIIWQLTEDIAEKVVEGYTLTEEGLSELEPYFIKEEIEETSFVYSDTVDNPFVPRFTYCWQVQALDSDGLPIGENDGKSEVWSFKLGGGAEIQLFSPTNGAIVDNPNQVFKWDVMKHATEYKLRICKMLEGQTDEEVIKNIPWFEQDAITTTSFEYPNNAPQFEDGSIYVWQVTSSKSPIYSFAFSSKGGTSGSTSTTPGIPNKISTIRQSSCKNTEVKWHSGVPCVGCTIDIIGHSGSVPKNVNVAIQIPCGKTYGGITSSYDGSFAASGTSGNYIPDFITIKYKDQNNKYVRCKAFVPLPNLAYKTGQIKCNLIGFEFGWDNYWKYWIVNITGLQGAVPAGASVRIFLIDKKSLPANAPPEAWIPDTLSFWVTADNTGAFNISQGVGPWASIKHADVSFVHQNGDLVGCRVTGPAAPTHIGKAGNIKCWEIEFTRSSGKINVIGKQGAVPGSAPVKIDFIDDYYWKTANTDGSFKYTRGWYPSLNNYAVVGFLDQNSNLQGSCVVTPSVGGTGGAGAGGGAGVIKAGLIGFQMGGYVGFSSALYVKGLSGAVANNAKVKIQIPALGLAGIFELDANSDGSFNFSKSMGRIISIQFILVSQRDNQGNWGIPVMIDGPPPPSANGKAGAINAALIQFNVTGSAPKPFGAAIGGSSGAVPAEVPVRIKIPGAGFNWVIANKSGGFHFSCPTGRVYPNFAEVWILDQNGNLNGPVIIPRK